MRYLMPKDNRKDKHPRHDKHKVKRNKFLKEGKIKSIREDFDYHVIETDVNDNDIKAMIADGVILVPPTQPKLQIFDGSNIKYRDEAALMSVKNFWDIGFYGQEINVAVMDSGVNEVPQLKGRILKHYNYSVGPLVEADGTYDTAIANGHQGHGTPVASIIAGFSNSFNGLAFKSNIIDLKYFAKSDTTGSGLATDWDKEIQCYKDIAECGTPTSIIKEKIHIVNCSFGSDPSTDSNIKTWNDWLDENRFKQIREKGILMIVSAGNENTEIVDGVYQMPGGCNKVITIGAIQEDTQRISKSIGYAWGSNYGANVDFSAYGIHIGSINAYGDWYSFSGTSGAAPLISSVFALYMSRNHPPTNEEELDKLISFVKSTGTGINSSDPTANRMGLIPKSNTAFIGHPVEGDFEMKEVWLTENIETKQDWWTRYDDGGTSYWSAEGDLEPKEAVPQLIIYSEDGYSGILSYEGLVEDGIAPYPDRPVTDQDHEVTYGTGIAFYYGEIRKPISMIESIQVADKNNYVHKSLDTKRTIKYNPDANLANYGVITEVLKVKNLSKGTEFIAQPNSVYTNEMIVNDQYELTHSFVTATGLSKDFITTFTCKDVSEDKITNLLASNIDTSSLKLTWDACVPPKLLNLSDARVCSVSTTWEWVQTGTTPVTTSTTRKEVTTSQRWKYIALYDTWAQDGALKYEGTNFVETVPAPYPGGASQDGATIYTSGKGMADVTVTSGGEPIYNWGAYSTTHNHPSSVIKDGVTLNLTGCNGSAPRPSFSGSYVGQQTSTTGSGTASYSASGAPNPAKTTLYNIYKDNIFFTNTDFPGLVIDSLSENTTYTFKVEAVYSDGKKSPSSNITVTTTTTPVITYPPTYEEVDTTPPDNVTGLVNSNITDTSLTLSWIESTSSDISSYDIFNGSIFIGNTSSVLFNVTGLNENTAYTFTVKAKDISDNISSGVSINVTTAKTPDTTPPANVTNFSLATFDMIDVYVYFTKPATPDLAKFKIYIDGVFKQDVPINTTSPIALTDLAPTNHTIKMTSVDTSGNESVGVYDSINLAPQLNGPDSWNYYFDNQYGYLNIEIGFSPDNPDGTWYEVILYDYYSDNALETLFDEQASPGDYMNVGTQYDSSMNYRVEIAARYTGYSIRYDSFDIINY